jgi:hypothetical protein
MALSPAGDPARFMVVYNRSQWKKVEARRRERPPNIWTREAKDPGDKGASPKMTSTFHI